MNTNWFEVYACDTDPVPGLLLLRPCPEGFKVLDPGQQNRRVHVAASHQDARYWLNEDEFELVGRKSFDED